MAGMDMAATEVMAVAATVAEDTGVEATAAAAVAVVIDLLGIRSEKDDTSYKVS
jgi:hypothetical protein